MPRIPSNVCCKLLAILVLALAGNTFAGKVTFTSKFQTVDPGEPLFLTPIIRSGDHGRAQEAAFVPEFAPVLSYSGFITVNEEYNSNMFFWFFPAEPSYGGDDFYDNDIPVVLWSDGGPGATCMISVFSEPGPFTGDKTDGMNYTLNPLSWHKKYHMIFLDNPVGIGFSFTENENGYIKTDDEAAQNIYEFLTQFFKMFPHLQSNPFYNAGSSYGGKYAIHTTHHIHQQNLNNPGIFINLTGIIMDSPLIEIYSQVQYGDLLFGAGVISQDNREELLGKEEEFKRLYEEGNLTEAYMLWSELSQIRIPEITGYPALYNLVDDVYGSGLSMVNMTNLISLNSTRRALHVGPTHFEFYNPDQMTRMLLSLMQSSKSKLEDMLKNGYRYLLLTGNVDVLTGHVGMRKIFDSMTWEGRSEFLNGERTLIKVDERPASYVTKSGNATFALIRNAGHGCYVDQPKWTLKAVTDFLG